MLRSAVNLAMTMALLVADTLRGDTPLWQQRMRCPQLLLLRGVFGCLAILCYTESLAQLPLAIALTISRLHPILGGVFSSVMLGERFRLPPIVVGLAGVALVATAKDGGGDHGQETALPVYGVALALGAAVFTAAAFTAVRALQRRGERPLFIVMAFNALGFGMSALRIWAVGGLHGDGIRLRQLLLPSPALAWILIAALAMQGAQLCLTRLLALQPTAQGSTSSFLVLAWGLALSVLAGEELPSGTALTGCVCICAPQMYYSWRVSDAGHAAEAGVADDETDAVDEGGDEGAAVLASASAAVKHVKTA